MRATQQMSITLPTDMAEALKTKVRSGEYASESEVIRDGLRALMEGDRAVASWLNNQVGPAYDALKADPSRAVTADQVRARLVVVASDAWQVEATWDNECSVWVATSSDVPGLVAESRTVEELCAKLKKLVPELVEQNGLRDDEKSSVELIARRKLDL